MSISLEELANMSEEETIKRNLDCSPKCSISKCERPPIVK